MQEVVKVPAIFRNSNYELVLLDCAMTPMLRIALEQGLSEPFVYLVAEKERNTDTAAHTLNGQWQPVIEAKITVQVPRVRFPANALNKMQLLVCTSALASSKVPYVLEWVNWQLYNGADHILIYLSDTSIAIPDILAPYARKGLVSFKKWQTPEIRSSVFMSQQVRYIVHRASTILFYKDTIEFLIFCFEL